jgi:hypothetical protein
MPMHNRAVSSGAGEVWAILGCAATYLPLQTPRIKTWPSQSHIFLIRIDVEHMLIPVLRCARWEFIRRICEQRKLVEELLYRGGNREDAAHRLHSRLRPGSTLILYIGLFFVVGFGVIGGHCP